MMIGIAASNIPATKNAGVTNAARMFGPNTMNVTWASCPCLNRRHGQDARVTVTLSFDRRRPRCQKTAQRHIERLAAVHPLEIDVHPAAQFLHRLGELVQLLEIS